MADRYWVGGTGTWDGTNTANWSASSGGSSGASVPTSADNVFFDANSNVGTGAFTVTMATTPRVCNDITISGLDGAMTLAGSAIGLTVSGSLSFPATNFTPTYTGTTTFSTANTGRTVTSNGVAFPGAVTFIGGGAWQLQDALTTPAANAVTLTSGSLDLNNKTLTCGTFSSTNSNTRSIAFGSTGSIVTTTTTAGATVLNMSTVSNFSFTGTSNISAAMSVTRVFKFGDATGGNPTRVLNINLTSGASVPTFTGLFRQINFTGSTCNPGLVTIDCHGFTLASGGTYTSTTFNLSSGGSCTFTGKQVSALTIDNAGGTTTLLDAGLVGATTTLTQGTLNLTNLTLTTNSFSSDNSNTRSIAFGTTGSIVVTGTTTALAMATATGFTFTGTSNISAAMSTGRTFNFGGTAGATTSNSLSISLTSGASVPTFTGLFRQIDFTGSTSNPGSVTISCHGFTLASGGTYALTSFSTFGDGTLTFVGKTIRNLTINGSGITTTLGDNGSVSGTTDVTLTAGTLALSSYTLTTPTFSSSNSNTRSINFGTTGQITLTGNAATVWTTATTTGFSSTGTFLVVSNYSGSTGTRTFSLGSLAVDFKAGSASGGISFGTAGTDIVSVIGTAIKDLDTSGFTGTFANATRTLTGNLTIGSGTTVSQGISTTTFGATSGTQLITTNGKSLDFPIDFNGVGGTFKLQDALTVGNGQNATLTAGSLDLNNFTLTASVFLSDSPGGTTRSVAFGSTGSIVLTSSGVVLSMARAVGFTFTGTSNVSSAMTAAKTFRFGSTNGATTSNRLNINLTSGSSVPTFSGSFRQINFTGSTCDPGIQTISCHGFTLASGGTYTSTNFTTVGDGTLTYTGKSISTLNVNTAGITTTLASAGQNATTTLTNGTLDLAGFTLTSTTTAATAAGTKNLTFNGGTLVCSAATTTAWNNAAPTGFTTTAGTGTGTISMTAATAKTFVGGSSGTTYNCTLNQGGAGTLTITGINIFNDITNTNATASQITFPASVTTFFNNFSLSGSAGNLVSIRSSTPGTRFTLSKSSGTVSVSYLDIQDSDATGGATWNASGANGNVDSGNNLGWIFGITYAVSIVESITAIDSILLSLTRLGAVLESATVSDSAASQLTANGAISETATVSDSAASQLTASSAISETAAVSDSADSKLTAVGLVLEQAAISDAPENILIRFGGISEQAVQSDSAASQLTANGAISETVTVSDSSASQLTAVAAISEQATQSDSAVSQLTAVGLVSESAAQSDAPDAKVTMLTAILEQGAISDAPENILIRFGDVAEQASLSDLASSQMTAVAAVSETARINDVAARALTMPCTILEGSQSIPESTFTLPIGTSFTGSTYFNNTSAGGGLTVVANGTGTGSGGGFAAGGNYVLFSGANTRSITTKVLDLRLCNNFSFSIIRGTNTNGGEVPDTGENIIVEYSINGGSSYTTIATILNTAAITTFTTLSYSMPVGAKTSSTIVRWRQVTSSAGAFDNYGIRTFTFDGQNAILMSDSPAARLVRSGAVSEQSTMADTPAAILIRQGLITELAVASETSAAILIRQGLLSEQATASETTAASLLRNGLISEQAAISDAAASQVLWSVAVSEQASISETLSSLVIYFTSILEQGTASVALTTQMTLVASILEQARSADQAVSVFILNVAINEALSAEDEATIRFLWELIDDNQIPNWQNASTNQTPGWGNIDTATAPNWQNISNDQSSGWGTINTAAGGNWNNINTSPE